MSDEGNRTEVDATHARTHTPGYERCWINDLTVGEGLLDFAECGCFHVPTPYESRDGIRCRCCFGLVPTAQSDEPGGAS